MDREPGTVAEGGKALAGEEADRAVAKIISAHYFPSGLGECWQRRVMSFAAEMRMAAGDRVSPAAPQKRVVVLPERSLATSARGLGSPRHVFTGTEECSCPDLSLAGATRCLACSSRRTQRQDWAAAQCRGVLHLTLQVDCSQAEMLFYAPIAVALWRDLLGFRALIPFIVPTGSRRCSAAAGVVKRRLEKVTAPLKQTPHMRICSRGRFGGVARLASCVAVGCRDRRNAC